MVVLYVDLLYLLDFILYQLKMTGDLLKTNCYHFVLHVLQMLKLANFQEITWSDYKKNPHNRQSDNDRFLLEGDSLVVNLGSTRFIDVNRILVINDFDLINVTKRENKSLIFDVNFFDLANNFVGAIVNNKLVVDEISKWRVDYKSNNLMINNVQRNLFLNFSLISGELAITGRIYYMGHTIQLNQDSLFLDETDLTIGTKNVTISHVGAAYDVQI